MANPRSATPDLGRPGRAGPIAAPGPRPSRAQGQAEPGPRPGRAGPKAGPSRAHDQRPDRAGPGRARPSRARPHWAHGQAGSQTRGRARAGWPAKIGAVVGGWVGRRFGALLHGVPRRGGQPVASRRWAGACQGRLIMACWSRRPRTATTWPRQPPEQAEPRTGPGATAVDGGGEQCHPDRCEPVDGPSQRGARGAGSLVGAGRGALGSVLIRCTYRSNKSTHPAAEGGDLSSIDSNVRFRIGRWRAELGSGGLKGKGARPRRAWQRSGSERCPAGATVAPTTGPGKKSRKAPSPKGERLVAIRAQRYEPKSKSSSGTACPPAGPKP